MIFDSHARTLALTASIIGFTVSLFAQTAADNPKVHDDGLWQKVSCLGTYLPDEFINVKPHAAILGEDAVEIVWMTKEAGSGWVDWTQDNWATTNRAWTSKYGIRDFNETIHKTVVKGFDPAKPVCYRAVSMKLIQIATGHIRFEGEPDFEWTDRRSWSDLAVKRRTYESGANVHFAEGTFGPLVPSAKDDLSIVVFNDVHHTLPIYTNLIQYAGSKVNLAVFNGDIIDHARSEADIIRHVNAPMAYVASNLNCAVRYVRGNHELVHGFPRHLADYESTLDGQFYGALTLNGVRIAFLDAGSEALDDAAQKGRDEWDFDGYISEESAWLARELESDDWKNAKARLVFSHVPPVWEDRFGKLHGEVPRIAKMYDMLKGRGVTAFIGAHEHVPQCVSTNEFADYPVFIGGAPYYDKATLTRCDVSGDGQVRVKIYNARGSVVVAWPHTCISDQPAPMSTDTNHWWWKAQEYRVNQVKTASRAPDVMFLGDSIFHYWEGPKYKPSWDAVFSGEGESKYYGLNLAIEGDRTETLLWRLENGLLAKDGPLPRVVVLLIGTNNTGTRNAERELCTDTARGVKAILDYIRNTTRGKTKIVVYGLLPRGKGEEDPCTKRNREVNEGIKLLCDGKNIIYRDIGDKFLNADRTVNTNMLFDKLHPAQGGYDAILEDLLPVLEKLLPPQVKQ